MNLNRLAALSFLIKMATAIEITDDDDDDVEHSVSSAYQWALVGIFGGIIMGVIIYLSVIYVRNKRLAR